MTDFTEVVPTDGDVANSYEYILDIAAVPVGDAEPTWLNVPDINALSPEWSDQTGDATTYAHKGSTNEEKSGRSAVINFQQLLIRDSAGDFQAEWKVLKDAADAKGKNNRILVRWYDALGASDAYQGTFRVTRANRPQTGAIEKGWEAWTLTSRGEPQPIENPTAESES